MRKSRTKLSSRKPRSCSGTQPPESRNLLAEVLLDARRSLRELVLAKGLEVFGWSVSISEWGLLRLG